MPRRDVVARARHRHGRRRPRRSRSSRRSRSRAACSASAAPATRSARSRRAASSRSSAPTCSSRAVVAQRMREGAIEETQIPRNPLDVLAQQIVAHLRRRGDRGRRAARARAPRVSVRRPLARAARERPRHARGPLPVGRVRRAAAAHHLGSHRRRRPRPAGRAAARRHERGHDPRPRPLRRLHRRRAAARVGELDEEMVYEARAGQVIVLGASSWRIEEITRDRVLVSPAPGVPGAVPFWKGEGVGRPYELGAAIGKFSRELLAAASDPNGRRDLDDACASGTSSPSSASRSGRPASSRRTAPSSSSASATRSATGASASSRRSARACTRRGRWRSARGCASRSASRCSRSGRTTASRSTCPTPTRRPRPTCCMLDPDELEELVLAEVGQTALFGARFRENAARALLIPRRRPGRAHAALAAAAQGAGAAPGRAQVLELPDRARDVPRVPAGRVRPAGAEAAARHGLRARELDLVDVETASASPFASSLLFDYIATYMYEDDTPPAERRAQALSLDRDLLRELLGQEELRELIDADALAEVEASLRPFPTNPERLHDLLRLRGDLRVGEFDEAHAAILEAERRAVRVRIAGEERLIAVEDAGRYRDALGVMPPSGLPDVFLEGGAGRAALSSSRGTRAGAGRSRPPQAIGVVRRRRRGAAARARARGEARARRAASRRHRARVVRSRRAAAAAARVARGAAARGRAGGAGGARPLPAELARHRPARVAARGAHPAAGARAARVALGGGGAAAPRARLPARAARPALRVRRARLGRRRARPRGRLLPRRRAAARASRRPRPRRKARRTTRSAPRSPAARSSGTDSARGDRARRRDRAARALGSRLGGRGDERLLGSRCAPSAATSRRGRTAARAASRARARSARPRRRDAGRSRPGCSPAASRTGARSRSSCSSGRASSRATACAARGSPAATARCTGELRALETLGSCRRGYFVEGLGGAQFALGGAVERLRELRPREGDEPEPLVLAAADPAQPYGAVIPWPKRAERPRGPRRGRARRPARRRAGALRRARRPLARPAARAGGGVAARPRSRRSSAS